MNVNGKRLEERFGQVGRTNEVKLNKEDSDWLNRYIRILKRDLQRFGNQMLGYRKNPPSPQGSRDLAQATFSVFVVFQKAMTMLETQSSVDPQKTLVELEGLKRLLLIIERGDGAEASGDIPQTSVNTDVEADSGGEDTGTEGAEIVRTRTDSEFGGI